MKNLKETYWKLDKLYHFAAGIIIFELCVILFPLLGILQGDEIFKSSLFNQGLLFSIIVYFGGVLKEVYDQIKDRRFDWRDARATTAANFICFPLMYFNPIFKIVLVFIVGYAVYKWFKK